MATTPDPFAALTDSLRILAVGGEVAAELQSARDKHGKQTDRPIGNGRTQSLLFDLFQQKRERNADFQRRHLALLENDELEALAKELEQSGDSTWMKIIFEEFAEALAAEGADVRGELIQLAAMAQGAVLAYDAQQS